MQNWYCSARMYCKTVDKILDTNVAKFDNVTAIDTTLTYKIIDWLGEDGFITVKAYPQVFSYRGVVEGGAQIHGYTDGKDIYLAHDNVSNISTILEEVIHLYTGAKDSSRDIQDIAFNIASHLLEEKL